MCHANQGTGLLVPAPYLEAIPRNLIVTSSGEFLPFDLEWQAESDLPLPFIVWRGLLSAFQQTASVAPPEQSLGRYVRRHGIRTGDLNDIAGTLLDAIGLSINDSQLAEYQQLEFSFQRHVFGAELVKARRPVAGQTISVRSGSADDVGLKDLMRLSVQRARQRLGDLRG
jgi:hypothetical protein